MPRYFTRAAGWVEDEIFSPEPGPLPSIAVSSHDPVDTGLVDANGNAIWRAPVPMGFGKDSEW